VYAKRAFNRQRILLNTTFFVQIERIVSMKQVYALQRQHRKHGSPANAAFSFAEPTRLFAPVTSPSAPLSPHERQEPPARVAQFRHSFDRLSIRPPAPDGGADHEMEQSGEQSDMQQTEKQPSSVQRREVERQPTPKMGAPLQKVADPSPAQGNNTGMPDTLKAGIESLSGLAMDDVRVHYNSTKPAQVDALAYTQGTEIHVGPGQEQHLPHEAWHVVQQKQGRVQPTLQMKGVAINDDQGLEKEADVMGVEANLIGSNNHSSSVLEQTLQRQTRLPRQQALRLVQPAVQRTTRVVQLYDIKAFDSWDEHVRWLLENYIPLPEGLNIEVGFPSIYIKAPQVTKAVYLPPGQEGLTSQGEELCDKGDLGAILLSKEYVEQVGSLPSNERVATLISTIRHELQHVENLKTGLVPEDADDVATDLDEAIAHSENILNARLDGNRSSAPLWDQIDHLVQAEDYLNKAGTAESVLRERAVEAVQAADQKLKAELREYGDPDTLMNEYLTQVDFITFDPFDPNPNLLTTKSRIMDEILDEALERRSGSQSRSSYNTARPPRLPYSTARPADVVLSSDSASGVFI
jgi:hypothetical protein